MTSPREQRIIARLGAQLGAVIAENHGLVATMEENAAAYRRDLQKAQEEAAAANARAERLREELAKLTGANGHAERMPDEFDPVAQAERRRVRAEALAGKGRAATELAKPAMGATSYENAVLGE